MIRPILLLALCQLPTNPAPPPPTIVAVAAKPAHPGTFDITDFKADPKSADNTAAIQAALNAAGAYVASYSTTNPGYQPVAVVRVPASATPFLAAGPLYVGNGVELVGEGWGSKVVAVFLSGNPLVVFGVAPPPATWGAVRPDLFGKLDKLAAPKALARRGFRTNGVESLCMFGNVFTHGGMSPKYGNNATDQWQETDRLTIDVAMEGPNGAIPAGAYIGSGLMGRWGAPWQIVTTAAGCNFLLSTQSKPFADPVTTTYAIPFSGPGVHRLSIQVDVSAATGPAVTSWVDGLQATTKALSAPPAAPCRLNQCPSMPFLIGQVPGQYGPPIGKTFPDFAVYGLCLSKSARYKVGALGSAQARSDGITPVSDLWRYFPRSVGDPSNTDPNTLAFLPFDDPATSVVRHMPVQAGAAGWNVKSCAFILDQPAALQQGNAIRNLELDPGRFSGMAALWTTNCLGLEFEKVKVGGGGVFGMACLPTGANYLTKFTGCDLSASDACVFGFRSLVRMRDTTFSSPGRSAIRGWGCSFDVADAFVVRPNPWQESFAQFLADDYGGLFTIRNVLVDNEGAGYSRAAVYAERHPYGMTTLRVEDANFGSCGAPAFALRDSAATDGNTWKPALLIASGIGAGGCPSVVEADGSGWGGSVKESCIQGTMSLVRSLGKYGQSSIVVTDTAGIMPATVTPSPAVPAPVGAAGGAVK